MSRSPPAPCARIAPNGSAARIATHSLDTLALTGALERGYRCIYLYTHTHIYIGFVGGAEGASQVVGEQKVQDSSRGE